MLRFDEQAAALRNSIPDTRRLVFFAGAGISTSAGYPSWRDGTSLALSSAKARNLISPGALGYANEELAKDEYYGVFDILKKQLPEPSFLEIAMDIFGKERPPSDLHKLLVDIPCRGVITTNFDECLAAAYAATKGVLPISDMPQAMASDRFFVVKPHGSVLVPKSMVLTTLAWQQVEKNEDFKDLLANSINNYQILFVGYSLKDPDFENIWQGLLSKRVFRSSAIYCCAEGALSSARHEEFRAKNIQVVAFPDDGSFAFVPEFLRLLAKPGMPAHTAIPNPSVAITQELEKYVLLCLQFSPAHQDRLVLVAKAIALDTFNNVKDAGIARGAFLEHLYNTLGQQSAMIKGAGEKALRELEESQFLHRDGEFLRANERMVHALSKQTAEMEKAEAEWVRKVLREQAEQMGLEVLGDDPVHVLQIMDRAFLDVGRDVAELFLFNKLPTDESERVDKSVDAACSGSPFAERREFYRRVLRRMLLEPQESEEDLLFKRLQAYFITTAYVLNPTSEKLLAQYANNHWVYFDSSVILLAMAIGHQSSIANKRLLQRTKALGMRLVIIKDMLNEVWHHIASAITALEEFSKAPTTLQEALAAYVAFYGPGNGNVFLEGFLNQLDLDPGLTPMGYLALVLGSNDAVTSEQRLISVLSESFGVNVDVLKNDETRQDELDPIIASIEELRKQGGRFRSRLLCEHEARMFYIIHLRRQQNPDLATKIWYVTNDRFVTELQRLESKRFPLPISYTPRSWFQYLDIVDFDSRGSRNFSRLQTKIRSGVFSGEIGIEAIRVILKEQRDLLKIGAVGLKELADVVVKDFHVKQAIADFDRLSGPNRAEDTQQADARMHLHQEVARATGQFVAVRKQEIERLKASIKEKGEANKEIEKKLAKEKYITRSLKAQLRPRKRKKRPH
jgi:hypothetical protein